MLAKLSEFKDLFEDADAAGRRQYLPLCPVGHQLNHLDPSSLKAKALRELNACDAIGNCIGCWRGQEYAVACIEHSTKSYSGPCVDPVHVESLVQMMAGTGPHRTLVRACEQGRRLHELVTKFADVDGIQAMVTDLDNRFGCTSRQSCFQCEYGFEVFSDLLLDLVDNGLSGEAGAAIREAGCVTML
jgi:hypothetical protein